MTARADEVIEKDRLAAAHESASGPEADQGDRSLDVCFSAKTGPSPRRS